MLNDLKDIITRNQAHLAADAAGLGALFMMLVIVLNLPVFG